MKNTFLIFVILFFAACSTKQREAYAHITQRRLDTEGKLVISYQFNTGEKLYYDSVEVINKIVPHDSLKVVFSPGHPEDSRLLIPR